MNRGLRKTHPAGTDIKSWFLGMFIMKSLKKEKALSLSFYFELRYLLIGLGYNH